MNDTQTITTCPRHPKVETNLRCGTCGTLICPRCLVQTPVGSKCKECGSAKSGKLFTLAPVNIIGASAVGLVAGAVTGMGVEFLGFFIIIIAMLFGPFAGEMIMRASGRKRGWKMEVITGVTMSVGAIGARLGVVAFMLASPDYYPHPPYGVWSALVDLVLPTPIPLIALVIAISFAVSRIRYL